MTLPAWGKAGAPTFEDTEGDAGAAPLILLPLSAGERVAGLAAEDGRDQPAGEDIWGRAVSLVVTRRD
jgi:hypothetical protein